MKIQFLIRFPGDRAQDFADFTYMVVTTKTGTLEKLVWVT